jgi:hypothetical protein
VILFCAVCILLVTDLVALFGLIAWKQKALAYHRLADKRLLELEPMKMERDEWEQRCIFLTQKLVEYERRGAI